jgi:hypothetical protein
LRFYVEGLGLELLRQRKRADGAKFGGPQGIGKGAAGAILATTSQQIG